jgi:adenylate cyclase
MSHSRRLAAILAADVVGYSRLMGADEEGTLERLKTLRHELIDRKIADHHGRIVKTTGDGLLVEFASVVDAARCAVEVQQAMPKWNASVPADRRIELRIGINLGDVIADGDDLYGDGVNIAARIEALTDAGGVFVSGTVYDQVRDRLPFGFEDRGEQQVKNIARPVRIYRLLFDAAASAATKAPAPVSSERPSIAVLAFTNMSGDPEQEYFSDGIADDIITELSRIRWLFVIARNSSFAYKGNAIDVKRVGRELGVRYVLEGSVRRSGQRIRLTSQLVDAEAGNHVWAARYDRDLADVFAVQDEISLAVTRAIGPAVAGAERRRALRRPPSSLSAWETYQRGLWHLMKYSVDHIAPARELFNRAIELDPTFASPHAELARLYIIESGSYGLRPFEEAAVLEAEQARMAVSLDPDDAHAHGMLAFALFNCREIQPALQHVELALSISPSCSIAHQTKGLILNFSGYPVEGRESFLLALQHDPLAMAVPLSSNISMTYYFERDYQKAADSLQRTLADNPTEPQALRWFAAALGQLGRVDEARKALSEALAKAPEAFERYTQQRPPWYRPEDYEHMLDGLRKAGWQG